MSELSDWLKSQPDIKFLLLAAPDVNGVMRGKSVPVRDVEKVENGLTRMALSTPTVDILGNEIDGCSLVENTGDCDIVIRPTGRAPYRSVLYEHIAIVPADFWMTDGSPVQTACRQLTNSVARAFDARGWQAVVALEIEFYLYDLSESAITPPSSPLTGEALTGRECASITDIQHFAPLLQQMCDRCADAGIQTTSILSENGPGMFEINLYHSADLMKAVDDMAYMRLILRDVCHINGYGLTFMPKPYADYDGAGQHLHFSILDQNGRNIFDNGSAEGSTTLLHAVGGLLETINELLLLCAPHVSSYRRLQPDSYAPTSKCWGYDNRSVPIRIPAGNNEARRIEYRVAGADANPYLFVSAVLMAALHGIDQKFVPPAAIDGFSYTSTDETIYSSMPDALQAFESSGFVKSLLPELLRQAYIQGKQQEMSHLAGKDIDFETNIYKSRI